jgi:hypothetical protein
MREADVFLLCFKVTDPSSLLSALNHWCPEIRSAAPAAPIVLVGCQADLRGDRDVLAALSRRGKAPVSAPQALTFSEQIGAVMYVETSAKCSSRNATSAFEVAAMASMGKLQRPNHHQMVQSRRMAGAQSTTTLLSSSGSTPSPTCSMKKQRFSSVSPSDSLERGDKDEATSQFWENLGSSCLPHSPHSECPKTPGSSRSASLSSKTRSSASIPSLGSTLSGSKTPKPFRRNSRVSNGGGGANGSQGALDAGGEKMVTITVQRLTADKTYEEIEVEVPAPIYETIQMYNDTSGSLSARSKERRSFGTKLRNFFTSKNI